jgi:hypothetical protein
VIPAPAHRDSRTLNLYEIIALVAISLTSAAVYSRLFHAPFLAWDDSTNIVANPHYQTGSGWRELWLQPYFGLYVPIISSVWAALFQLGGESALIYRVFNALVHVVNVVLFWRLLRVVLNPREDDADPARRSVGIVLAVAIFALHPLQTATVGWISGGRDLLATFFAISALLALAGRTRIRYAVATVLYAAALLSKPSVATVPVAVVIHSWATEGTDWSKSLAPMLGWLAIAGVVAAVTAASQSDMMLAVAPLYQRPVVAMDAIGFYIQKAVWPFPQSVDYGRTPSWLWAHLSAAALTGTLTIVALILASRRPARRVWLLPFVMILPVAGLVPFAFQRISTVADHYMYLPLAACGVAVATTVAARGRRVGVSVLATVLWIVGAAIGSFHRVEVWKSDEQLFTDALNKNPRSFVALNNLARVACLRGAFDIGVSYSLRALAINPTEIPALGNKAFCLYQSGDYDEVISMQGALRDPDVQWSLERENVASSGVANLIAGAFFQRGDFDHGWPFLCQAMAVSPGDTLIRKNASDVAMLLKSRGIVAGCPRSRLPWREFAEQLIPDT